MLFRIFLFIFCLKLYADPWGKDAELAFPRETRTWAPCSNLGVNLSERLIAFHQEVISPADGPRSHYVPSSSQYTLEAIRKYGFLKGWAYGCDRLMRENNERWVYREVIGPNGKLMKWDPVR